METTISLDIKKPLFALKKYPRLVIKGRNSLKFTLCTYMTSHCHHMSTTHIPISVEKEV